MSTRALRKLQREQEQERQFAALKAEGADEDTESSEEESIPATVKAKAKKKTKAKLNAFQILEGAGKDEDATADSASEVEGLQPDALNTPGTSTPQSTKPMRKKKKKPKNKAKEQVPPVSSKVAEEEHARNEDDADEIDRALQELKMRGNLATSQQENGGDFQVQDSDHSWEKEVSKLLAINSKNLNPTNEMKSLFGSIALERTTRNQGRPDDEGRVDLETALNGRHSPVSHGKELGNFAKRRNIFMQGQENWPLATSRGLGMEAVKESEDAESHSESTSTFGKHYEIVHNSAYQDTQRQFRQAVESMSAENMIHLLIYNPYHIATLLQVAEIAKHQGDHSVTGDLLERALFTFGRSVHSTFGVSLREGRARLSFDKTVNRELYLAIWRYLQNLEMRGTWRTAFEWTKMLLSFNILSDPYGVTHCLDQYALRGRQHDALIALCSDKAFGNTWSHLPNMQISLALAYHRAAQPKLARQKLALAMHRYPYILSHLCSTLDISPLPKHLWGITPSTDAEKLYTELYTTRAKDLWATPEATALLVEVAETIDSYSPFWEKAPPAPKLEISLEDARHILLLDIPILIALIPRNFRSLPTAQYDVLPPPSSANDAGLTARAPATADGPGQRGPMGFLAEFVRAASRGFLGGGTAATSHSHLASNDSDPDEEESTIADQDLFNMTLADANLTEEDRIAILSALAEDADADSDEEADEEAEVETGPLGRAASILRSTLPQAEFAGLIPEDGETVIGEYDNEERPLPFNDRRLEEPTQVRNSVGARPDLVPDRDAEGHREDTDAPLQPDQHRPYPRTTNHSPPPPRVFAAGAPPAPTVDDEEDEADEPFIPTAYPFLHSPPSTSTSNPNSNHPPATPAPIPTPDPQRIQRHLLTTGLTILLQSQSQPNPIPSGAAAAAAMTEYVNHLRQLRHRDREWTLGVVRQRVAAQRSGDGDAAGGGGGGGGGGGESADEFVERIRRALG